MIIANPPADFIINAALSPICYGQRHSLYKINSQYWIDIFNLSNGSLGGTLDSIYISCDDLYEITLNDKQYFDEIFNCMPTQEQLSYILKYDNTRYDTAYIIDRVDRYGDMNEVYKYLFPSIASECRYIDKHITEVLTNDVLDKIYYKYDASNEVERILNMIPVLPSDYSINSSLPNTHLYGIPSSMLDYIMYYLANKATYLNSCDFNTLYNTEKYQYYLAYRFNKSNYNQTRGLRDSILLCNVL